MMLCITELTQQNMGWNRREMSSDWLQDESQEHDRIQKKSGPTISDEVNTDGGR
jgi:hypothetical protein